MTARTEPGERHPVTADAVADRGGDRPAATRRRPTPSPRPRPRTHTPVRKALVRRRGAGCAPLRAEARRGFAPWAAAALLLALGWALAATASQWQGSWNTTTDRLSGAAGMIGVPFALAAGAWQGGRERRLRMSELRASMPRAPLAQLLTAALPLAWWLAAAYLVAVAGTLLACAPYAPAGGPVPTVFAGAALSLAACTLLGHVAGRLMPWRLTAPALAICAYVLAGVGAVRAWPGPGNLVPAHLDLVGDGDLPVWWYPLVSAGWAAGLAAAAALAHAAYRRATALLPLAAALGAAVVLVHTGDGMLRDNPLAHRQVCDDSTTPRVCVNAVHPNLLPDVTRALSGLTGRLEGVQNLPVRFEDLGRSPHEDEAQLPTLTPFGWSVVRGNLTDPEGYAWEAAQLMVRPDCGRSPSARRVRVTDEAVLRWLAPDSLSEDLRERFVAAARQRGDTRELARSHAEDTAYAHLTAMADAERRSFLSRYFATVHDCDPNPSEVPAL